MTDKIEKFYGCSIQHGKYNDRVYVLKTPLNISNVLPQKLINLAKDKEYSKIIAKIPAKFQNTFLNYGYKKEAFIPSFFYNNEEVLFMAYYLNSKREKEHHLDVINEVIKTAKNTEKKIIEFNNAFFTLKKCTKDDVEKMSELYKRVFLTYPFPIFDKTYLLKTMKENVEYFCIVIDNEIVALASCEKDEKNKNVEMTDFAVAPEYRGNNFAYFLLRTMEKEMRKKNYKTFYTIARAESYGMNKTFASLGYIYSGRLKNNTNIAGKIESMNIWYKTYN